MVTRFGGPDLRQAQEAGAAGAGAPALPLKVVSRAGAAASRDPTNFRGLVLGCIEAKFCK